MLSEENNLPLKFAGKLVHLEITVSVHSINLNLTTLKEHQKIRAFARVSKVSDWGFTIYLEVQK